MYHSWCDSDYPVCLSLKSISQVTWPVIPKIGHVLLIDT